MFANTDTYLTLTQDDKHAIPTYNAMQYSTIQYNAVHNITYQKASDITLCISLCCK